MTKQKNSFQDIEVMSDSSKKRNVASTCYLKKATV